MTQHFSEIECAYPVFDNKGHSKKDGLLFRGDVYTVFERFSKLKIFFSEILLNKLFYSDLQFHLTSKHNNLNYYFKMKKEEKAPPCNNCKTSGQMYKIMHFSV